MISLSASGGSITFTFSGNSGYLQDGVITVPVNSLTLVTDNSEMFTFKKSASNDIFISGLYSEIGMTKAELESFYKANMVGSTGGGGGITSGEVQSMIDSSISGKVNTSDNIVSGASIMYEFASGDTTTKNVLGNGIRVNEFYVKYVNNASVSDAAAWFTTRISNTGGFPYSNIGMTVDASDYAITNIVSTSGDITTTLENGVVKVVLPEGYYINYLQQNVTFQISYDKYDISSGQTADVINEDLIDTIQDIYNEVPKRYVTSISTGLMSKQMNIHVAENAGNSQSSFLLGDSLKGDNNKLDVYFAGETISYTPETLNTGTTSYTKVPASPINKYGNGFGEIDLAVNTGFTGSSQSVPVIVNLIDNYSYTYNFSFTYDIVNKTINGGQSISNSYSNIYLGGNKIYIYPKINYKFRVLNIECSSGFICGVDRVVKDSFVFTGVTGNGYVKQGQDVIDELFRAKASYNEMNTAINQATSGKVNTTAITTAVTSASTDSQIPSAKATYDAVSGKQDTLSAGTNITISGNVISAEGGGKAIEAGRGISITTGETADTVSFNLPISAGTGENSIIIGKYDAGRTSTGKGSYSEGYARTSSGQYSHAEGSNTYATANYAHAEGFYGRAKGEQSHAEGYDTTASGKTSHVEGTGTQTKNESEHASGHYNNSVSASTTFGDSGNTLFSVGNGTADNARHNAFEIRQNGDIYLSSGGTDIKLQDHLGGGGGGTVDQTIISGSTNAVAGGAVYNKIDEVEQVTAAGLNALNDNFGGLKLVKLSQAQYDALTTKDNNTLYVIV